MNKIKHVLFLMVVFIGVGCLSIFFTHQDKERSNLVSPENYVSYIRPWINDAYHDQSLSSVSKIRDNFINFKGSDNSMGAAHMALFLAFDAWQRFLVTGDNVSVGQAINHFSKAAQLLPELSTEINNLENILKQEDV